MMKIGISASSNAPEETLPYCRQFPSNGLSQVTEVRLQAAKVGTFVLFGSYENCLFAGRRLMSEGLDVGVQASVQPGQPFKKTCLHFGNVSAPVANLDSRN